MALAQAKEDLSRYPRLAATEEIVITRHGRPAGIIIGFETEDDWFDYRLENHPEFLGRVAAARAALAAGQGVRFEELDSRPKKALRYQTLARRSLDGSSALPQIPAPCHTCIGAPGSHGPTDSVIPMPFASAFAALPMLQLDTSGGGAPYPLLRASPCTCWPHGGGSPAASSG